MDTKKRSGFTIIELVVVIIILAILAAFAIPKYMDMSTKSRVSVVNGLYGSMQAAAALVYSLALANGITTATTNANLGGGLIVSVGAGSYPTADPDYGIGAVLGSQTGFTPTNITSGVRYDLKSGTATCSVQYLTTTGQPNITAITSGC